MSADLPWNVHEGNLPISKTTTTWDCPLVNTEASKPVSWPQLGTSSEATELYSVSNPAQSQEISSAMSSTTVTESNTDHNGTSAWGRPHDQGTKATSGWGVPPSGRTWGQPAVDDGTAVWGKSSSAQQPQGNWSGQAQASDSATTSTSWGNSTSTDNNNNKQDPQHQTSSQQLTSSATQPGSTPHISWAKAASAGLPPTSSGTESSPIESEKEPAENSANSASQAPSSNIETDPVRKIVNSHEGWGKRPIQQGTSWNITTSGHGLARPINPVSNGTEAWGKPSSGNMPPASNWGDNSGNKVNSGWDTNSNQTASSTQSWGVPTQSQPPHPPIPSSSSAIKPWVDPQQQQASGRWSDMPGLAHANPPGWGTQSLPQKQSSGASGWGSMPSTNGAGSPGWGNAVANRPVPPASGWGSNMMPQSPIAEQPSWDARRPVDNGTSAWGDAGTYSKVNMWGKQGKMGPDIANVPTPNSSIEAKGWGVPPSQQHNRPPSPKGWGDISPTGPNPVGENGTSAWGTKNDKWEKSNTGGNWNAVKLSGGGWGQNNEPQWRQPNSGSHWNQNDFMGSAMDHGPRRGMMPPQPNMNPQMMFHNQSPPAMPPPLQYQFQQIRHAVNTGVIPSQVLNPQFMTPQHVHAILQLINKAAEFQNLQVKASMLSQNKPSFPNAARNQELDQCRRAMLICQQQMEAHKQLIIQNASKKTAHNFNSKINGPIPAGIDLGGVKRGAGDQPLLSPLSNMNHVAQALPSTAPPGNISSSITREQKSRLMNNWKRPSDFGGVGDKLQQAASTQLAIGMGPGGDAMHNGLMYRSHNTDVGNARDSRTTGMPSSSSITSHLNSTRNTSVAEQNSILADFGPPEFTPGKPWRGFRTIDPESDPNITPGSVAIAKTMSINTVRDADQVLSRDRSLPSETSMSTITRAEKKTLTQSQASSTATFTSLSQTWSSDTSWGGRNHDNRGSWLVLTNCNQVDPSYMRNLCSQHGTVQSFQPHYPVEQTALVKYSSPDEATNARKSLNMYMVGNTMLVATVATDHEVNNFRFMSGSGQFTQTSSSRPSLTAPHDMASTGSSQQYWGKTGQMASAGSWGNTASPNLAWSGATGEEMSRIMSPMHSLLPENLLGGESM